MLLVVGAASFTSSTRSSLRARTTPRHSRLSTHVRVSMLAPVEELGVEEPLAELTRLVARLGTECPWTRAQNTTDVVRYTRAELLEVEQASCRSSQLGLTGAEELADEQTDELTDALTDELGDVLFNALLLIEVARRERPQLSVDASATAAVRKLRRRAPHLFNSSPNLVRALVRGLSLSLTLNLTMTRRAPYLFGGPPVSSVAEAEAAWQAAKAAERGAAERAAVAVPVAEVPGDRRTRRSPPPTMRLRGDGRRVTRRAAAAEAAAALAVVAAAVALCQPALALPPPRGAAEPLVPLLQCRVLLAELAALAMAGGTTT